MVTHPALAEHTTAYLGRETGLLISDLKLAETTYVLSFFCEIARLVISEAMRALIVMDASLLLHLLVNLESHNSRNAVLR